MSWNAQRFGVWLIVGQHLRIHPSIMEFGLDVSIFLQETKGNISKIHLPEPLGGPFVLPQAGLEVVDVALRG